jgi:hypothetical protein
MLLCACERSSDYAGTEVALQARYMPSTQPQVFEVRAQVAAPQSDLHYKWFADHGECDPQESGSPTTFFRFAENSKEDHVAVEVWRAGKRLSQNRILVKEASVVAEQPRPNVQIEITEVPVAQAGGPNTHADIAGRVTGDIVPDYKVVLYARDNGVWWIQPLMGATHKIGPDRTWASWTHTGQAYAALLVRPTFSPIRTLDTLPPVKGDVLARAVAEGRKQ